MARVTVLGPEFTVVNELVLPYDPTATEARRDRWRKAFVKSLVGLGISILIALVLFLVFRWNDPLIWFFYAVFGALNLIRIGVALTRWLLARRTLARMPRTHPAVRVDRAGVGVDTLAMSWPEVTHLVARTPWWSTEPRVELHRGEERAIVRLDQLPAVLSTVDQAVRGLSAGHCRIDTRELDR